MNRFAWCDQENPGAWDYTSVTSQAGSYLDVEPANPIIAASTTLNGIIFTAKKAYNSVYLGMPYLQLCKARQQLHAVVTRRASPTTSSMIIWMSKRGCSPSTALRLCLKLSLVRPWVDDDIDLPSGEWCTSATEVWWFFPAGREDQKHALHLLFVPGLVGNGPDGADGGDHLVVHRAHHHGRRSDRVPA